MPRHELARLKLMRQPMRSRVAQIVQPCEKSGLVPGFDTIEHEGKVVPCAVKGQRINHDATILWDAALLRAGYPGLLKPDGRMADILFGQVAVVFGDAEFMAAPPPK